ncbi:MAG: hypothetical protein R3D55_10865 [Chloroflexota bacterium]
MHWNQLSLPWQTAVPHPHPAITLGKQLFASGELWQFGQHHPPAEQLFGWLQNRLAP